jgi:hypothetical protein
MIEIEPSTEARQIYRWDSIATHEIINGHIPTNLDPGVSGEGWLRIRPTRSNRYVDSRNYDINFISVTVDNERFERATEHVSSWDGSQQSSRLTHNYRPVIRRFGRRHDFGEHPVFFKGTSLVGRDTVVEVEGIHFRSGNILGALAMTHGAVDDSAPIKWLMVDQTTEKALEEHRRQLALIEGIADPKERRIARAASAITNFFGKK